MKRCYQVAAAFVQFLEEPTFQLKEACPKIISKGLSRCAKLTKPLRDAQKFFASFLYLALFQSLFFFMKVLHFLSMLKNVLTHWNPHSFPSDMAAVSVITLPEEHSKQFQILRYFSLIRNTKMNNVVFLCHHVLAFSYEYSSEMRLSEAFMRPKILRSSTKGKQREKSEEKHFFFLV